MPISSALGSSALLPGGLGFRNVLINGAMNVAQRGTSAIGITSGEVYRTVDRWRSSFSSVGTWTETQSTDAPPGFGNSLKFQCTTANTSLSAGSYLIVGQDIEGQNVQQFAKGTSSAKPAVLSFWVKAFQTGTYVAEIFDSTNNRQISRTYTIDASGTWEYKTIQLPPDTTGALNNNNAVSIGVYFWVIAGTTFTSGTANGSWASASNGNRAAGLNVNTASSTNNYWQITGVQLEQNYQPTPFEQRPIGVELALCQRYYYQLQESGFNRLGVVPTTTTNREAPFFFPVTMRAAPTVTITGGSVYLFAAALVHTPASTSSAGVTPQGGFQISSGMAAAAAGATCAFDAFLIKASAEL